MVNNKLILSGVLFLLIIPLISASTITWDKSVYAPTETATWQVSCSAEERNRAYTVNITNSSGNQIELDTGDTSTCVDFFGTYIIPSNYITVYGDTLNATLQGTQLEGTTTATVQTASDNDLIISNFTLLSTGCFVGQFCGFTAIVKDENAKEIINARVTINLQRADGTTIFTREGFTHSGGEVMFGEELSHMMVDEGTDYIWEVGATCGGNSSSTAECFDEDGVDILNSDGEANFPFTVQTYITFNEDPYPIVYSNGTDYDNPNLYSGYEKAVWRRNASNNFGKVLRTEVTTYLVNNDTGKIYGVPNEGSLTGIERTFLTGNSSLTFDHELSISAQSGIYYIRLIFNIFEKGEFKTDYIINTETFNITGLSDYLTINDVYLEDANKNIINETANPVFNISAGNKPIYFLEALKDFEVCFNYTYTVPARLSPHLYLERLMLADTANGKSVELLCEDERTCPMPPHKVEPALGTGKSFCFEDGRLPLDLNLITSNVWSIDGDIHVGTETEKFTGANVNCGDDCEVLFGSDEFWIDGHKETGDWIVLNSVDIVESTANSGDLVHITWNRTSNIDILFHYYKDMILKGTNGINHEILVFKGLEIQRPNNNSPVVYNHTIRIPDNCIDGDYKVSSILHIPDTLFSIIDSLTDDIITLNCSNEGQSFEERSTEALEDIANKTGTFHFDIDCPTESEDPVTCTITGYIESGSVKKETDFDCYIDDGISATNWNSMVSTTPYITTKSFSTNGLSYAQHTVTCKASYYNMGSRTDTFSDSFVHIPPTGKGAEVISSTSFKPIKKFVDFLKFNPVLAVFILVGLFIILSKKGKDNDIYISEEEEETEINEEGL